MSKEKFYKEFGENLNNYLVSKKTTLKDFNRVKSDNGVTRIIISPTGDADFMIPMGYYPEIINLVNVLINKDISDLEELIKINNEEINKIK